MLADHRSESSRGSEGTVKFTSLLIWVILQMLVWPIYCGSRMRSGMASICYFATFAAFWLGWFAK
jgi:hypothetical protein